MRASNDDSVTMMADDVIMTSSEETTIDEGDRSGVDVLGEGSRGRRGEGVRKNNCSETVEETEMKGASIAEELKGKRMVKIGETESVGTIESLSDDVIAS